MSKIRDIRDPMPEFDNKIDKIKYWFTNVFWFHYRFHTIAVLGGLVILAAVIQSCVTNRDPDFTVAVVTYMPLTYNETEKLREELAGHIGDINGDGIETAEFLHLNFGASDPQIEASMRMMVAAQAQRNSILLFIFDGDTLEELRELMPFADLSGYFPGGGDIIDLSGSEKMRGLVPFEGDFGFYAAVLDKSDRPEEFITVPVEIIKFLLSD